MPGQPAQGGSWLIAGRNPVIESLRAGRRISRILIAEGSRGKPIDQIAELASARGMALEYVSRETLDRLAGSEAESHQGVVAFARPKEYVTLDHILEAAGKGDAPPLIVALDGIEDPRNFGAILRTCDACGVHGVIIRERRAVGLTPAVAKASAGAIESVPVARVTNLAQAIERLKQHGIWIAGAHGGEARDEGHSQTLSIWDADFTVPLAVIVGGEGRGVGRLLLESCDFVVSIPMMGRVSSLNASVALAVVLYEVLRQRQRQGS
ncbi:MAG: 23S rRNA (guanosine(2251)-2'-O)-methyltransferase RlmB [Firmicutes bacterium]|nr:23S rRNA (guanosine(2251)-2'-O)-methyltransferase RlmB [Bacillota bacterium]